MKIGLREIVFILLLMALPLGAWQLSFRPQNARSAEMIAQIEAKQKKLRALNYATASIGDLKNEIVELEKAMEFFRSKLPSEKEIDKILKEIWMLAEANRLTTKGIHTMDRGGQADLTSSANLHAEQLMEVKLEGDFMGFYTFLQALEDQPRIMRIRKMTLEQPQDYSRGEIKANFVMSIFFEGGEGKSL